ncbi:hypothetical protein PRUPE_1G184300 [Prunus persica]|uniref:Uncharacterized protein n=1 Tax=Prunus persica TaxID=3760 RepID=A0A251QZA8_PRUPE|nr:hypothetical protein PRUPE_1G184300 [Prunus persica]
MKPTRPSTLMRMISTQLKAQMLGFTMLTTKKVEVVLMFINQGGVETTTFVAIHFMQTRINKVGDKYNNKSSVPFLLGLLGLLVLLVLLVIASSFFFYYQW